MTAFEDLVREVGEWHVSVFGDKGTNEKITRKIHEESGEFLDSLGEDRNEAADVLIGLCAWIYRNECDLVAIAQDKLTILKGRDQMSRDIQRGIFSAEEAAR